MTADEGPRPSPDDEPPANDPPSPSDPAPSSVPRAGESTDHSDDGADRGAETAEPSPRRNGGAETRPPDPVPGRDADESVVHRFRTAKSGPLFFLRELATSAGAVLLVGLLLFGVSGVWPPMVAVESGSMEPHMQKGDLIFITEPGRFAPEAAHGSTGVVTAEAGSEVGYRTFGGEGSVVVYDEPGHAGPPIIHRAQFYVEAGENWYDRADPDHVSADNCRELLNCPAPHAGFITKGDANGRYDQASGIAGPVRSSWITGVAQVRIPYLGWVRLGLADVARARPYGLFVGTDAWTYPGQVAPTDRPASVPTERDARVAPWRGGPDPTVADWIRRPGFDTNPPDGAEAAASV